jgi:hypothetical protein
MASLVVQPRYPNDPAPEVVEDFVAALTRDCPEHEIEVTKEEPWAHQVSLWEILTVWLPVGISVAEVGKYVLAFTSWLKRRRAQAVSRTPAIKLYGPDGKPLKLLSAQAGIDEVVEEEPDPNEPWVLPRR